MKDGRADHRVGVFLAAAILLARKPQILAVPLAATALAEVLSVGAGHWFAMIAHGRFDVLARYEFSSAASILAMAFALVMSADVWNGGRGTFATAWQSMRSAWPMTYGSALALFLFYLCEQLLVLAAWKANGVVGLALLTPALRFLVFPLGVVFMGVFVVSFCDGIAPARALRRTVPYVRASFFAVAAVFVLAMAEQWYAPMAVHAAATAAFAQHLNGAGILASALRAALSALGIAYFSLVLARLCADGAAAARVTRPVAAPAT